MDIATLFDRSELRLPIWRLLGGDLAQREDQADMVKLADTVHLIFGEHHPARRARRICAMYFLYPTAFEEPCRVGGFARVGETDCDC